MRYILFDKARHDKMVALVDRMLEMNKKKHSGKLAPSELKRLEPEIASTNREIDELVYPPRVAQTCRVVACFRFSHQRCRCCACVDGRSWACEHSQTTYIDVCAIRRIARLQGALRLKRSSP